MPYAIIDSKSETHTYGFIVTEKIVVTLTLLEKSPGKFAMDYEFVYSGISSGDTKNGDPVDISGNCTVTANPDPKVIYTISNYSDSGTYISMQITITVDMKQLGTKTVFDQTLGGKYGTESLQAMVEHIAEISKK